MKHVNINPCIRTKLFQATSSDHTKPSSQESNSLPTLRKNINTPRLKINKTSPTHNSTNKNGMADPNDNLKCKSLRIKEGLLLAKCRCNKDFIGKSSIQLRSYFGVFNLKSNPQSLTAATLDL